MGGAFFCVVLRLSAGFFDVGEVDFFVVLVEGGEMGEGEEEFSGRVFVRI